MITAVLAAVIASAVVVPVGLILQRLLPSGVSDSLALVILASMAVLIFALATTLISRLFSYWGITITPPSR